MENAPSDPTKKTFFLIQSIPMDRCTINRYENDDFPKKNFGTFL